MAMVARYSLFPEVVVRLQGAFVDSTFSMKWS